MQTSDSQDFDPYNMLSQLDTGRDRKTKKPQRNMEAFENIYQKSGACQSMNSTSNLMQKMQSPYNSKTLKNKFTANKLKKNVNVVQGINARLNQCSSKERLNSEQDQCKRCDQLIDMLKNTRFLAR